MLNCGGSARIARLDALIAELGPLHAAMAPIISTGGAHLFRHIGRQRQLDRDWLQDLLVDVEAGKVRGPAIPQG